MKQYYYVYIPVPGEWSDWSAWSMCTVTCGGGHRLRTRSCNMTSYGDITAPCIGNETDVTNCHNFDCLPRGMM
jgi:chondroitin sulfate proteoglycan 4